MEKRRFAHEFALLFLIALAIGVIILQSNFRMTGNVVSNGVSCDGNWTCGDWTTCADGNQSRSCTLDVNSNSTNCVSPVTEIQTCPLQTCNNNITLCLNSTSCVAANYSWDNNTNTCNLAAPLPVCDTTHLIYCLDATNCTIVGGYFFNNTCISVILSSISITSPATKLSYNVGESLNILGLVVTGTYSNNSTVIEPISTSDITGFNSALPATNQILTITFGTRTTNYSVNIVAPVTTNTTTTTTTTNLANSTDATSTPTHQTNIPPVTAKATQSVVSCTPNWQCGDWQECVDGNQARACTDINNCGTQDGIPATSQACTVVTTNETKPVAKPTFFSMVGSVVQGPISAVGTFFSNRTNIFIVSGALIIVVCGFFSFRFFKKHKIKIIKQ